MLTDNEGFDVTAADRVFEAIRNEIVSGAIERGTMFSIYQLADKYEVSRTPARDAVLRLANLGLVSVEKNHGVRVNGLTVSDVRDIFRTRILLEVPSAYHAACSNPPGVREKFLDAIAKFEKAAMEGDLESFIQADIELHDVIVSWNGNSRVSKIVAQIREETLALGASTYREGRSTIEVFEEHVPIYEAILNGDAPNAAGRMKAHLERTARILLTKLSQDEAERAEFDDSASLILLGL